MWQAALHEWQQQIRGLGIPKCVFWYPCFILEMNVVTRKEIRWIWPTSVQGNHMLSVCLFCFYTLKMYTTTSSVEHDWLPFFSAAASQLCHLLLNKQSSTMRSKCMIWKIITLDEFSSILCLVCSYDFLS